MAYRSAAFPLCTLCFLALLALGGGMVVEAAAQVDGRVQLAQNSEGKQSRAARISASKAAAIVQKQYGGKVMNVSTRERDGRVIYRVKLLVDGRMRLVSVDGNSGKILN